MKKNFFSKFNSYNFWVSLSSAMLILIQAIGTPAGLEISEEVYMAVVNSVLGIFVLLGIVPKPEGKQTDNFQAQDDTKDSVPNIQDSESNPEADTLNLDENQRELLISYQRTNT